MPPSLESETKKKNPARFARLVFWTEIIGKTHFCGFWSDDTRIKKLFLLFFLPPCLCCRAQRGEIFVFSLRFFFWNGLRAKIEALENLKFLWISKVVDFWGVFDSQSGRFWRGLTLYRVKESRQAALWKLFFLYKKKQLFWNQRSPSWVRVLLQDLHQTIRNRVIEWKFYFLVSFRTIWLSCWAIITFSAL